MFEEVEVLRKGCCAMWKGLDRDKAREGEGGFEGDGREEEMAVCGREEKIRGGLTIGGVNLLGDVGTVDKMVRRANSGIGSLSMLCSTPF